MYTIKSGDTLSQIAKELKIPMAKLLELNPQIKDANKIRAGASLNTEAQGFKMPEPRYLGTPSLSGLAIPMGNMSPGLLDPSADSIESVMPEANLLGIAKAPFQGVGYTIIKKHPSRATSIINGTDLVDRRFIEGMNQYIKGLI